VAGEGPFGRRALILLGLGDGIAEQNLGMSERETVGTEVEVVKYQLVQQSGGT
jgi:hypothetical protein